MAFVAADVFAAEQRPRVAVGDVDRVAGGDPAQVGQDAAVDHVAFFVRNRGGDRDHFPRRVDEPGRGRAGGGGAGEAEQRHAGERDGEADALDRRAEA